MKQIRAAFKRNADSISQRNKFSLFQRNKENIHLLFPT